MNERERDDIIEAIYDTSLSPSNWPVALERLGAAFKCNVTTLIDRNIRTMQGSAISTGIDASGQAEYFSTWSALNVFIESTPRWTAGSIVTDQQLLPKSRLLASDYYNGFMRPRDMNALLRVSMRVDGDVHQSISLMRPARQGEFDVAEVERCRLLLPHLQRAGNVAIRLNKSSAMLQAVSDVLEEKSDGIMLVDHAGKILFANRAARMMADRKDGFTLRQNSVEAIRSETNRAFQKLLGHALGQLSNPQAPRAGVMHFARMSDERDYIVTVTPLPKDDAGLRNQTPRVCITITDPAASPQRPLAKLQDLYELTMAEARLAEQLFVGQTPEQAARLLNIKISTARTHISQIFRKTDVRRQTELIGLILRLI